MPKVAKSTRGWRRGVMADCVSLISAGTSVNGMDEPATIDEPGVLKVSCVTTGAFRPEENKRIIESDLANATCPVEAGCMIVSRANSPEHVGSSALVLQSIENLFLSDKLWKVRARDDFDIAWLHSFVSSTPVRRQLSSAATGSSNSMKNISQDFFLGLPVLIPPVTEQRRIAEILRTWDEAIEKLKALRAAKERRLQTLREKLTFLESKAEPVRLGDVTEEVTARNGAGRLGREMVMGVSNSRGIVPMREQTIADDIARYKLVPHQAFAYNPMRINVGSIAMNESMETILVSPDYVVFACLPDRLEPDFLDHLRKTKWWAHFINSGGSGSVRQRTYYADLAAMKAPLPSFERQTQIADILSTARRDVDTTAREITALQRQKRGLTQKLLTGEWRTTTERNEV